MRRFGPDQEIEERYFPMKPEDVEYWRRMQGCSSAKPDEAPSERRFVGSFKHVDVVDNGHRLLAAPLSGRLAAFSSARRPH